DGFGVQPLALLGKTFTLSHAYVDDGDYTVIVRVTDHGGSCDARASQIFVPGANGAPPARARPGPTLLPRPPVQFHGMYSDPGVLDTRTFTWHVTATNGQTIADGHGQDFDFTPIDNGTYLVKFTVADNHGDVGTSFATVTALNVGPSVSAAAGQVTVNEGQTATKTGTWSDAGSNDLVALSASVGTVTRNSNGTWTWSYAASDGPSQAQTVTITATDKDGAISSTTFTLLVNNVAPTATLSNSGPVGEGNPVAVSF